MKPQKILEYSLHREVVDEGEIVDETEDRILRHGENEADRRYWNILFTARLLMKVR